MTTSAAVPTLHIGILTYNGLAHTQRCLRSLVQATRAPWRALVRDNASSDDTPQWLTTIAEPRIAVHCADDNLGVGGGRNWLLAQLLPSMRDDDLVVLLDNDIELFPGWEQPFLDAFATYPRLGVAGRWAFSMLVHETFRDILSEHTTDDGPVDTVQGCTFVIRAAAAREIGCFDDALGRFWHEDDDYSIRALAQGWDVRRVHTDAIVHHEHGSGVALRPDTVSGSARNQAYLARKWRALGVIGDDGVPRRLVPDELAPVRDELAAVLGRLLVRTELNSALRDVALLVHGEADDAQLGLLATPLARLLLEMQASAHDANARQAQARLDALLVSRRASAPSVRTPASSRRALSAVCTPAAWDDPRWAATCRDALRDGSGRDYFARSETLWRDGQLLYALRTLGVLRRDTRVLVLGHPQERLIAALTHVVGAITVRDVAVHTAESVLMHAGMPLGQADVQVGAQWRDTEAGAGAFDVVLCPNASRFASARDFAALLISLASHCAPGGVTALGVSVRVSGPMDGSWVDLAQCADDALLARASLRRVGSFDDHVADETLLAAAPLERYERSRPRLARIAGAHVLTFATLVARRG